MKTLLQAALKNALRTGTILFAFALIALPCWRSLTPAPSRSSRAACWPKSSR